MKKAFLLLILFFPLVSPAADVRFTTVFYDDGGVVYVGLVRDMDGKKESQVLTFPFSGGERVRIPLPPEITNRDVLGLVPEKEKLFVLTHLPEDPQDGPMLHVFDREKLQWTKVGHQKTCPTFTKVKLSSSSMTFFCEVPLKKPRRGKVNTVVPKTIRYGRDRLHRSGTWRFPEFMLRYKGNLLLLEGEAPTWDRLRLKSRDEEERLMKAEDLFQLPPPVAGGSPATSSGFTEE